MEISWMAIASFVTKGLLGMENSAYHFVEIINSGMGMLAYVIQRPLE